MSTLVTLYVNQEDAESASDVLTEAVDWYSENEVGNRHWCEQNLCIPVHLSTFKKRLMFLVIDNYINGTLMVKHKTTIFLFHTFTL